MKKSQVYRGYKIVNKETHYLIYWSKDYQSAANTLEDAQWIIDQELDYNDEE